MDPLLLPLIGTSLTTLGLLASALISGRGLAFTQAAKLLETISAERNTAHAQAETLRASSETAWRRLEIERAFSAEVVAWGEQGAPYPPGPPKRPALDNLAAK